MELSDEQIWITHLNYELSTLAELPTLVDRYDRDGPDAVKNACLESALLHGRVMIEFLVGRPQKGGARRRSPHDVQPSDFLASWSHPNPEIFDGYLDLIDPHFAHLSKKRSNVGEPPAGYLTDLVDQILVGFELFVDACSSAGVSEAHAFRAALTQARAYRSRGPTTWPLPFSAA
jgi:hypothetical protein